MAAHLHDPLLAAEDVLFEAEELRRSFRRFVRGAWAELEPDVPFVDGWHVGAICEHMQAIRDGQLRRLVISMPPRATKSRIVSVAFPAWDWIDAPQRRYMTGSYALDLAMALALDSRSLILSDWYQERWASSFALRVDEKRKRRYANDRGGVRYTTSTKRGGTGHGADIALIDDPHDVVQAESERDRTATVNWIDRVLTRRGRTKEFAIVIAAQRTDHNDASGHVLRRGGWDELRIPLEYEPRLHCQTSIGWTDPRTEPGTSIWPERYGAAEIEEMKRDLTARQYATQAQQDPPRAAIGGWPAQVWRRYKEIPAGCSWLQSWDLTFKETERGSWVVGQVWAYTAAQFYLVFQLRQRLEFTEQLAAIQTVTRMFPQARRKLIEDAANGQALVSTLRKQIPGLVLRKVKGTKANRMEAVRPYADAGNVHLPEHPLPTVWGPDSTVDGLIAEFANGIVEGGANDQIDAASQALLEVTGTRRRYVT